MLDRMGSTPDVQSGSQSPDERPQLRRVSALGASERGPPHGGRPRSLGARAARQASPPSGRLRQRSSSRSTKPPRCAAGRCGGLRCRRPTRRSGWRPRRNAWMPSAAAPSMTTNPATPSGGFLFSDAEDQHGEAEQDGDGRENDPPPRMEARVGGAHRRGELRILGQRPLDLLEQPLLVFGQRHGTPPRPSRPTWPGRRTVRSRSAALPQVYEGHSGSESGSKSRFKST